MQYFIFNGPFLLFFAYQVSIVFLHLLLLSFVAFFHFSLGHNLTQIESWVSENIWQLVLPAKLLCFFILYRFKKVEFIERDFKSFYISLEGRSHYFQTSVLLVFWILVSLSVTRPFLNESWSEITTLLNLIGHFFHFGLDFVVCSFLLKEMRDQSSWLRICFAFYSSALFYLTSYAISPSKYDMGAFVFFQFLMLMIIYFQGYDWRSSFTFLVIYIAFYNTLFGQDMFLGDEYSLFVPEGTLGPLEYSVMALISLVYLKFKVPRSLLFQD